MKTTKQNQKSENGSKANKWTCLFCVFDAAFFSGAVAPHLDNTSSGPSVIRCRLACQSTVFCLTESFCLIFKVDCIADIDFYWFYFGDPNWNSHWSYQINKTSDDVTAPLINTPFLPALLHLYKTTDWSGHTIVNITIHHCLHLALDPNHPFQTFSIVPFCLRMVYGCAADLPPDVLLAYRHCLTRRICPFSSPQLTLV